jgi:hypothetical protein
MLDCCKVVCVVVCCKSFTTNYFFKLSSNWIETLSVSSASCVDVIICWRGQVTNFLFDIKIYVSYVYVERIDVQISSFMIVFGIKWNLFWYNFVWFSFFLFILFIYLFIFLRGVVVGGGPLTLHRVQFLKHVLEFENIFV